MSENVKITRAETMSQNFRHIVISTHKSVEMCRAETMCTFSLRFFCILQICKGSVTHTHTHTHTNTHTQIIPFRRCFSHQKSCSTNNDETSTNMINTKAIKLNTYEISLILLPNNWPTFAQDFCQRKRAQHVGRQHCWSNVGEMLERCWAHLRRPLRVRNRT